IRAWETPASVAISFIVVPRRPCCPNSNTAASRIRSAPPRLALSADDILSFFELTEYLCQPRRDALTIQETDWSPSFRNQRGQETPSATWKEYLGLWSGLYLVWLRYFCGSLFLLWSQWCT